MAKNFMPEVVDPKQKLQLLVDNCDASEETTYYRDLDQDELDNRREQLVDNLTKISSAEDELSKHKQAFKVLADPLKLENKTLLVEVKTRKAEVSGRLFHIFNQDDGMRETYDEAGDLVGTRRLLPNERQMRLAAIHKAANQ